MHLDASTTSAIAALVVAVVAMLVAFAQALQQYLSSGMLMRLGDKSVFTTMPGGAYRVWSWTQFRYKILYKIPTVRLPREYYDWYGVGKDQDSSDDNRFDSWLPSLWTSKLFRREFSNKVIPGDDSLIDHAISIMQLEIRRHPFQFVRKRPQLLRIFILFHLRRLWKAFKRSISMLIRLEVPIKMGNTSSTTSSANERADQDSDQISSDSEDIVDGRLYSNLLMSCLDLGGPSEACWVSFWRTAQYLCAIETKYMMIEGDADRCPTDLQVLPMKVSLKDIVTVGFLMGMEIVFNDPKRRLVQMEGQAGVLISSPHPLLGTIVRFFPEKMDRVETYHVHWKTVPLLVARIWGRTSIAGRLIPDWEAVRIADNNYRFELRDTTSYSLNLYQAESQTRRRPAHRSPDSIRIRPGRTFTSQEDDGHEGENTPQRSRNEDMALVTSSNNLRKRGPKPKFSFEEGQNNVAETSGQQVGMTSLRRIPGLVKGKIDNEDTERKIAVHGDPKTTSPLTLAEDIALATPTNNDGITMAAQHSPNDASQRMPSTLDADFGRQNVLRGDRSHLHLTSPKRSQTLPASLEAGGQRSYRSDTAPTRSSDLNIFSARSAAQNWRPFSRNVHVRHESAIVRPSLDTPQMSQIQERPEEIISGEQDGVDFAPPSRRRTWDEEVRARIREAGASTENHLDNVPLRPNRTNRSLKGSRVAPTKLSHQLTPEAESKRFIHRRAKDLQDELDEAESERRSLLHQRLEEGQRHLRYERKTQNDRQGTKIRDSEAEIDSLPERFSHETIHKIEDMERQLKSLEARFTKGHENLEPGNQNESHATAADVEHSANSDPKRLLEKLEQQLVSMKLERANVKKDEESKDTGDQDEGNDSKNSFESLSSPENDTGLNPITGALVLVERPSSVQYREVSKGRVLQRVIRRQESSSGERNTDRRLSPVDQSESKMDKRDLSTERSRGRSLSRSRPQLQDSKDTVRTSSPVYRSMSRERRRPPPAVVSPRLPPAKKHLGSLYWLCQMDIVPGFWSTSFSHYIDDSLCENGAILVIKALKSRLGRNTLRWESIKHGILLEMGNRLLEGASSWPLYTHKSPKGGSGSADYSATTTWPSFEEPLRPIVLLYHHEHYRTTPGGLDKKNNNEDLCELMAIDCWLNEAGQRPEIANGPNNLLKLTPSFVHELGDRHARLIRNLNFSNMGANYGEVAEAVEDLDFDISLQFTESEAIFLLLATYRAMRVGECITYGILTDSVQWIQATGGSVYMA